MITIKTEEEIEKMRAGGKILASILRELVKAAREGITTAELDDIAERLTKEAGAEPSFKNYRGYPAALCTSVNNQVVHTAPSPEKVLKEGDVIGLDYGIKYLNYFTDHAVTIGIGKINDQASQLISVTKKALEIGISNVRPGNRIGNISESIQQFVEGEGFSVVRQLVGHGVGKKVHEEPRVPNFGKAGSGPELKKGMTLAIEPMVNVGGWKVNFLKDGWTIETADGSLSAHLEHTVAVTESGVEIITK